MSFDLRTALSPMWTRPSTIRSSPRFICQTRPRTLGTRPSTNRISPPSTYQPRSCTHRRLYILLLEAHVPPPTSLNHAHWRQGILLLEAHLARCASLGHAHWRQHLLLLEPHLTRPTSFCHAHWRGILQRRVTLVEKASSVIFIKMFPPTEVA